MAKCTKLEERECLRRKLEKLMNGPVKKSKKTREQREQVEKEEKDRVLVEESVAGRIP